MGFLGFLAYIKSFSTEIFVIIFQGFSSILKQLWAAVFGSWLQLNHCNKRFIHFYSLYAFVWDSVLFALWIELNLYQTITVSTPIEHLTIN